jgi:hypothetical protein
MVAAEQRFPTKPVQRKVLPPNHLPHPGKLVRAEQVFSHTLSFF